MYCYQKVVNYCSEPKDPAHQHVLVLQSSALIEIQHLTDATSTVEWPEKQTGCQEASATTYLPAHRKESDWLNLITINNTTQQPTIADIKSLGY